MAETTPEIAMDAEQYAHALAEASNLDLGSLRAALASSTDPKGVISMGRFTLDPHWKKARRNGDRFFWHVPRAVRAEALTSPRDLEADRRKNLALSDTEFLAEMEAVCGHVREKKTGKATLETSEAEKPTQQAPEAALDANREPRTSRRLSSAGFDGFGAFFPDADPEGDAQASGLQGQWRPGGRS